MIKLKDKSLSVYRGDYRPVNVFKNTKQLGGFKVNGTMKNECEFTETYNDMLTLYGKSGYKVSKNLCPSPKSSTVSDGLIETVVTALPNGKFDLLLSPVKTSGAVMLMSPIAVHSALLPAGTYTASSNSAEIGVIWDEDLYSLPYTFTLDSEQTVYFGVYNCDFTETDLYLQIEQGESATEYQQYFGDSSKPASLDNVKQITSSTGTVQTFGQNLFYFSEETPTDTKYIKCKWDFENQTLTLNGSISSINTRSGYDIILSSPLYLDLEQGEEIVNSRHLISGSCKISGTASVLWSVFSIGTTQGTYYSARAREANANADVKILSAKGVVPAKTEQGYKYYAQLLTGLNGRITFENAVYKFQIVKGSTSKNYKKHTPPSSVAFSELRGIEVGPEFKFNYTETENGEQKYYLSDSINGDLLIRRLGELSLIGNEEFEIYNQHDNTICFVSKEALFANCDNSYPICNCFELLSGAEEDKEGFYIDTDGRAYFRLNNERGVLTAEGFAALISAQNELGTPLTVIYPLAESTTEILETKLKTYPGYTRVKAVCEDGYTPVGLAECIKTEM